MLKIIINCVAIAGLLLAAAGPASSQDYPARPVRIISLSSAGGASDVLGRLLAKQLAEQMKQQFVVENRPGAGGVVASKELLRSPPDGYTLLIGTSTSHGISPSLYANLGFDAVRDFVPIAMLADSEYALSVRADSPYRTLGQLIEAARGGKRVTYGSAGNGSTAHLASALLGARAGVALEHVPYKGVSPAIQDLMGGSIDFMFNNIGVMEPLMRSGKLRILATSGSTRSAATPEIPTLAELGIKDYEVKGWYLLLAPKGTPPAVIERLNREVNTALATAEMKSYFRQAGEQAITATPAQTGRFMAAEIEKFRVAVQAAGARVD